MKFAITSSSANVIAGNTCDFIAIVRRRNESPHPRAFSMSFSSTPVAMRKNMMNECAMTSRVVLPRASRKCCLMRAASPGTR